MIGTKIVWLHISDLQFRERQDYDSDVRRQALLQDIKKVIDANSLNLNFIAVTGDVAYSGQHEEYVRAAEFLNDLLRVTHLERDYLFIVPGNHDMDRSAISDLLQRGVQAVDSRDIVDSIMDSTDESALLMRPLRNFQRFIADFCGDLRPIYSEHIYFVRRLSFHNQEVAILGLNSAWLAMSGQNEGTLVLGERPVRQALQKAEGSALSLTLVHHPFSDLRENDRAVVQPLLLDGTDFVLRSYSHIPEVITRYANSKAVEIAAGQENRLTGDEATYNIVEFDLHQRKALLYLRRYSTRRGGFWTADTLAYPDISNGTLALQLTSPRPLPSVERQIGILTPNRIYVESLRLMNFRCFGSAEIRFADDFTVLIGDNASGKSAVLEALVLGVGTLFQGLKGFDAPPFSDDQVKVRSHTLGETLTFEHQYPASIRCGIQWGDQELSWYRHRPQWGEMDTNENANEIVALAKDLSSAVQEGSDVVLPLLAYYSTGRLWRTPRHSPSLDRPRSRLSGYDDCLDPASHFSSFTDWMKRQELVGLQEKKLNRPYLAVKTAISRCIDGVEDVLYSVSEDEIVLRFAFGQQLPFRMLSEGIRNMMAMVADIAYRTAVLNPQFYEAAPAQTPGIVLIDELDLHLHPKWQQVVVSQLGRSFPKIQFIATTHSPLIVGGLRPEQIVRLHKADLHPDDCVASGVDEPMVGWRADQVLTSSAFGLESSRDPETQELISTYSRLSVRHNLSNSEDLLLKEAAQKLSLRLPTSAERREAREAMELIRNVAVNEWRNRSDAEKEKLMTEVRSQLLAAVMGQRRPQ